MNIVDYVILGLMGVSILFGFYRGFISSVLNLGGALLSFVGAFFLYPHLSAYIFSNKDWVTAMLHYTDANSRLKDLAVAVTNVAQMGGDAVKQVVSKAALPPPLDKLLQANLENQAFASSAGVASAAEYVTQTIVTAAVNIVSFLLCFVAAYLVLSILQNMLRAIFRFPVLKQLDWLAGGAFGFFRGMVICYALFALVPLVMTIVPLKEVQVMLEQSQLAPIFHNGNLILAIMNGKL